MFLIHFNDECMNKAIRELNNSETYVVGLLQTILNFFRAASIAKLEERLNSMNIEEDDFNKVLHFHQIFNLLQTFSNELELKLKFCFTHHMKLTGLDFRT